jgi:hypothetical protein
MLTIDPSDCRLEIGIGRKFMRSLVWHFARFLRHHLSPKSGMPGLEAEIIEREARRLATRFADDMQDYFRRTLSETYETLDHLSADGIVDLYVQENLPDFEADYLSEELPDFRIVCARLSTPPLHRSPETRAAACH